MKEEDDYCGLGDWVEGFFGGFKFKPRIDSAIALSLLMVEHRRRRRQLGLAAEHEPWLGLDNGASMP